MAIAKKTQTNIYLSDEAREALRALADRFGVSSQSAVVEMLIREKARKEGLKIKGLSQ